MGAADAHAARPCGTSYVLPSRDERGKKKSPTWNGRANLRRREANIMWKAYLRAILKQIEDLMNQGMDAETILRKIIESIKEMLK